MTILTLWEFAIGMAMSSPSVTQVLIPLNTYQGQFPEMRKKIDKRGRKLIDFDKERHNIQQLQTNPNRNEAKFARYSDLIFGTFVHCILH